MSFFVAFHSATEATVSSRMAGKYFMMGQQVSRSVASAWITDRPSSSPPGTSALGRHQERRAGRSPMILDERGR